MNKLKNITIIVLAAGLLITFFYFRSQLKKFEKESEKIATTSKKTISQAARIINNYIDTAGRKHIVIDPNSNQLPVHWYNNGTAISGGLVDTVAQALQIARKQLQEVTQVATQSEAKALRAQRKFDSLQRVTYYYKDHYLQLAYRPAQPGVDTTDHGEFDYKYNDSINVVQYWKRNWMLGAKKSYIDIFSLNPRTTINGASRLRVEQKEPTFGLRVQAVANYSFSRGLLNLGPGIQFDIKRFSLVGTYYYDFDAQRFRPAFGARYDLIRF